MQTCRLREAAHAGHEPCPADGCALWEDGCLPERLGIPFERDLARHLLELRLALEAQHTGRDREL